MHLNELAKCLKTIGEERRIHILCILMKRGKLCVSDISDELGMSIATTSHHLQVLADEGLVNAVREGKRICYSLPKTEFVKGLQEFICAHAII